MPNAKPAAALTPEELERRRAADRARYHAKREGQTVTGGRERKPTRKPASRSALKRNVASVLTMANLSAAGVLPAQLRPDLLTPDEIEVLATGIAVELEANPKLLAYFQKLAAASGPHMVMLAACAVVAAPRMARRNLLPIPAAHAVITAGTALVGGHAGGTPDLEPRTAPRGRGGHGIWQVDADGVAGETEEMAPLRSDQAG